MSHLAIAALTTIFAGLLIAGAACNKSEQHSSASRTVDAAPPKDATSAVPAAPSASASAAGIDDEMEPLRKSLAKLSSDPKAIKPKKITPPSRDEPDHTTYEYAIDGIGDVVQSRKDAKRWALMLVDKTSPDYFAPRAELKSLIAMKTIEWWRVVDGPFRGSFVMRSPGGIEVRSKDDVCSVHGGLPAVSKECARD
jgi:hypothetical protein